MYKYFVILSFFIALNGITNEELFLQANKLYSSTKYDKALEHYQKITKKNSAIWYNMGNCMYHEGNYLRALLYWNRASTTAVGKLKEDCDYNCSLILGKLQLNNSSSLITHSLVILLLQIFFFCSFGVFLVIVRRFLRQKKIMALSCCGIMVITFGLGTFLSYRQTTGTKALIMANSTPLYVGPDKDYHQVGIIPGGTVVHVLDHTSTWAKINWNNQKGWLASDLIETI